jgi:hypothetical protein
MHHRTNCTARLRIVSGNGFEQLERCCSQDLDSHISQAAMSVNEIDEDDEECNEEEAKEEEEDEEGEDSESVTVQLRIRMQVFLEVTHRSFL